MTTKDVRGALVRVLAAVQASSGRACPSLDDDMRPIGDLEGFDSVNGVEATIMLEAELGRPLKSETVFVVTPGKRALRMGEIVKRVMALLVEAA